MKVILIKTVPNLGKTGEVKEVSEGFARNYLLPNGLVKIASDATINEMETKKRQQIKKVENRAKKNKEIARKINNIKITIKAKADEKKTLFGSINAVKIAEELKERKFVIDTKYIKLEQPIKSLGYYDVLVDFGTGVTAKIGLTVAREE
ncbi:MAG: 50S ribosomal protein L9 [Candidatus Parcubacteria bacterium]|nr:50S ribosomal protein L9 [Candidatus Parcubacteria bacterium]